MAASKAHPQLVKVNGERHLYKRTKADGTDVFVIVWRDQERKIRKRTVERAGIQAARVERDRLLGARASGGQPQANPRLTFREAADAWLAAMEARDLRDTTKVEATRIVKRHLLPRFTACRLSAITVNDLRGLLAGLRAKGLSERSCSLVLSVLGRVYRHAKGELRWAGEDPTALLPAHDRPQPSRDRKRPFFRSAEALEQTVAAANEAWRPLFKLLTATGARISEALALTWADIELDAEPQVVFRRQVDRKGRRQPLKLRGQGVERATPIPTALATVLREHKRRAADRHGLHSTGPDAYVFATRTGRPLSQRNVARELRRAQVKATQPDGTPTYRELHNGGPVPRGTVPGLHSFRHTTGTRLLYAGWTADEVARLLGHKDANTFRAVYSHELDAAERRKVQRDSIGAEFGSALDA